MLKGRSIELLRWWAKNLDDRRFLAEAPTTICLPDVQQELQTNDFISVVFVRGKARTYAFRSQEVRARFLRAFPQATELADVPLPSSRV